MDLAAQAEPTRSCIQRSRILQHPLGGGIGITREMGLQNRSGRKATRIRAYAACLEQQASISPPAKAKITAFAYDKVTGDAMIGAR